MRFLVVDDHPVLRKGVASVLSQAFPGATVGELESVEQAVGAVASDRPDLIIIDPKAGGGDATSAVERIRRGADCPVVVFVEAGDTRFVTEGLRSGARGCVRKDSPSTTLIDAVKTTRAGGFYIDPMISMGSEISVGKGAAKSLTERQREIMQLFSNGAKTNDVAAALGISPETVRTHNKRVLEKLNAHTRTHAVAIAMRSQEIE